MSTHVFKEKHFDLDKIATSGQVFRWRKLEDSWFVPVSNKTAKMSQENNVLSIECPDDDIAFWQRYLALDEDYDEIFSCLEGVSEAQDQALAFSDGIRILRQPFFETAISFLCSQNNNIPNISNSIEKLCGGWDEPFPTASDIVEKLQSDKCSLGYRVPYLSLFCRAYIQGKFDDLDRLAVIENEDAERPAYKDMVSRLCHEKGIGEKVANCICLFSLGYDEAVPRDVWIKKLEQEYDVVWDGEIAGIQQQFLFFAIRNGVI